MRESKEKYFFTAEFAEFEENMKYLNFRNRNTNRNRRFRLNSVFRTVSVYISGVKGVKKTGIACMWCSWKGTLFYLTNFGKCGNLLL